MCSRADETINDIVSECPKLAQKEYKRRHDWIKRRIQWKISGANGIHVKPKWYEHQQDEVIENDSCKILWDLTVQTDHFVTARKPGMIVIDKEHFVIGFAIPYDTRVDDKEVEKINKYMDLVKELKKVKVVPLVVGTLGTPTKALEKRLKTIGIETKITKLQKSFLIHTSRILRKVLECEESC